MDILELLLKVRNRIDKPQKWISYWSMSDDERRLGIDGAIWKYTDDKELQNQAFCNTKYFILDDLGMGIPETGYKAGDIWAIFEEIVNARYDRAIHGYPGITVISTNLDLIYLKENQPRILSRFQDNKVSTLVLNEAPDYRKSK